MWYKTQSLVWLSSHSQSISSRWYHDSREKPLHLEYFRPVLIQFQLRPNYQGLGVRRLAHFVCSDTLSWCRTSTANLPVDSSEFGTWQLDLLWSLTHVEANCWDSFMSSKIERAKVVQIKIKYIVVQMTIHSKFCIVVISSCSCLVVN